MRIISGRAGGIPLQVPKTVLRPTADRVREAVFSMLGDRVEGATALDLFAGSGSYGLECLSRGAKRCVFVEADRSSAPVITANLRKARLDGGTVVTAPVEAFLKGKGAAAGARAAETVFDLIFADPPYAKKKGDRDWDSELLASPALRALLAPGGLFLLESFARGAPPPPPDSGWTLEVERRYGDCLIRLFSLPGSPEPPVDAADVAS